MPDQDIFDRFDLGDIPVDPMPAADVRRRGDRMRRRRAVATTVGAAAAVTVIALGGVVVGRAGGGDSAPPPVGTPTDSPTATSEPTPAGIPAEFPIDSEGSAPEVPPDDFLAQQLEYCGVKPLADVSPLDARSAQVAGGEMNTAVTLLLFETRTDAARAVDTLQDAAAGCPREVTNVVGEVEVLPEAGDDWPGQTIRTSYPADAAFVHAVPAGPALLLSSWYVAGTPAEQGLAESRAAVADQVAALDEIWDVPGWRPVGAGNAQEIPVGFPIEWGAEKVTGNGGTVYDAGPRTRVVVEVSPCDRVVWPVTGVDRLAFTSTGPGVSASRELVVFASTDEAKAAMAGIRAALEDCPTEVDENDPTSNPEQAWDVQQPDNGREDRVSFSRTYTDGLPGGTIWQFARVGNAILAVSTDGEYSRDSVPSVVDRLTGVTEHLAPEMCAFTEEGC